MNAETRELLIVAGVLFLGGGVLTWLCGWAMSRSLGRSKDERRASNASPDSRSRLSALDSRPDQGGGK